MTPQILSSASSCPNLIPSSSLSPSLVYLSHITFTSYHLTPHLTSSPSLSHFTSLSQLSLCQSFFVFHLSIYFISNSLVVFASSLFRTLPHLLRHLITLSRLLTSSFCLIYLSFFTLTLISSYFLAFSYFRSSAIYPRPISSFYLTSLPSLLLDLFTHIYSHSRSFSLPLLHPLIIHIDPSSIRAFLSNPQSPSFLLILVSFIFSVYFLLLHQSTITLVPPIPCLTLPFLNFLCLFYYFASRQFPSLPFFSSSPTLLHL